jgi:hypothetical protein
MVSKSELSLDGSDKKKYLRLILEKDSSFSNSWNSQDHGDDEDDPSKYVIKMQGKCYK